MMGSFCRVKLIFINNPKNILRHKSKLPIFQFQSYHSAVKTKTFNDSPLSTN